MTAMDARKLVRQDLQMDCDGRNQIALHGLNRKPHQPWETPYTKRPSETSLPLTLPCALQHRAQTSVLCDFPAHPTPCIHIRVVLQCRSLPHTSTAKAFYQPQRPRAPRGRQACICRAHAGARPRLMFVDRTWNPSPFVTVWHSSKGFLLAAIS